MAKILDGRELANRLKEELKIEVARLREKTGKVPTVKNVVIGEDHATCAYANSQVKAAKELGIGYELIQLPARISQNELIGNIKQLNGDPLVNGIMIHQPVPQHINYRDVTNYIDVKKDLEGINVANIGRMMIGESSMIPCTPAAVMAHIKSTGVDLRGKEAVVVGHSKIVGKPLALLLLREMATVTVCHVGTSEAGKLEEHIGRADILIVAVGVAELINGEWIKEGAMVLDVGINDKDGKMVGDVHFVSAEKKASYITPVPGGVGPVTVVMLMKNAVEAFKMQNKEIS